jgi:undecaprenyl-diphosphatase
LSALEALLLGIVQGLTEFLPISSSGHLILVPWAQQYHFLEHHQSFNKTFDVALHAGTLVAVLTYFRAEIARLLVALWRSIRARAISDSDERVAWAIVVATIPAVIAGGLGQSFIEDHLGEPWQIAILLAVFALVLWIADRSPAEKEITDMSFKDALGIGLAQMLALMPGVSRSGVTITAGRFLRLDRESAARFSFLLLVPTTLGAVVWKGVTDVLLADLPAGSTGPFVVGMLASAAAGIVAIGALIGYVQRHTYTVFVIYRLIVAALILLAIETGARSAGF